MAESRISILRVGSFVRHINCPDELGIIKWMTPYGENILVEILKPIENKGEKYQCGGLYLKLVPPPFQFWQELNRNI